FSFILSFHVPAPTETYTLSLHDALPIWIDPDGTGSSREVIASHYHGKELNSPNDVVVKSDGSIYFTDPTYGRMPGFGVEREQELDRKSTRLNSSHVAISYAVFCLKIKNK